MKKHLLTLFGILLSSYLYAQKFEVSLQANTGLFSYAGAGTASSTAMVQTYANANNYVNNPYGNKNGVSYGLGAQVQYVTKGGFIAGLQAGYDILRSQANITQVYPFLNTILYNYGGINYTVITPSSKGTVYLQNQSINLNPYIGYRININKVKLDILPGTDISFNVVSNEKGKATTNDGTFYQTDSKLDNAPVDVRLKLGLAASYNRIGLTASYAYGLSDYNRGKVYYYIPTTLGSSYSQYGNTNVVKSRLIRLGLSYRIF